jgi:rhamnosyltransferase
VQTGYHRVDYAISSGTLIALEILDVIGEMEEKLFIGYVDIDSGLWAQSKGYGCFGLCAAHMEHHWRILGCLFLGRNGAA